MIKRLMNSKYQEMKYKFLMILKKAPPSKKTGVSRLFRIGSLRDLPIVLVGYFFYKAPSVRQ